MLNRMSVSFLEHRPHVKVITLKRLTEGLCPGRDRDLEVNGWNSAD